MNLDDKIKDALKMDDREVSQILSSNDGLISRFNGIFSGPMAGWNIYGFILAFVVAGFMFWFGYRFFVSETLDDQLFWGLLAIAAIVMTMGIKIWFWLEMNRVSTMREIKRVELAVAQLMAKLDQ